MNERLNKSLGNNDLTNNSMLNFLQMELDNILQQQNLVLQKVRSIKEYLKSTPNTDPSYDLYLDEMEIDEIELDELKIKEEELKSKIKDIKDSNL